jgi:hypothetical protein
MDAVQRAALPPSGDRGVGETARSEVRDVQNTPLKGGPSRHGKVWGI